MMDKNFKDQIGRNLKVYVDDVVIKSASQHRLLDDVQETFAKLRLYN